MPPVSAAVCVLTTMRCVPREYVNVSLDTMPVRVNAVSIQLSHNCLPSMMFACDLNITCSGKQFQLSTFKGLTAHRNIVLSKLLGYYEKTDHPLALPESGI